MRRLIIVAAISVFLALSCKNAVSPDPGLDYTADTPRKCIQTLEYALNAREILLYGAMLSTDFTFYFDDDDVGTLVDGYTIPKSWGYEEECRAVANMLRPYGDGGALKVEAFAYTEDMGDPPDDSDFYFTSDVYFRLEVKINSMWGVSNYDDDHYFEFTKTTDNGDSYWLMAEWRNYHELADYGDTIGFIKAYFYSLNPLPENTNNRENR
ncbi:MAG: hypothetical protein GY771_16795 [bacterium]|nr:hypothetical protein [bacterium]